MRPLTVSDDDRDHRIRVRRRVSCRPVSSLLYILLNIAYPLSRVHAVEGLCSRQGILALPSARPLIPVRGNGVFQSSAIVSRSVPKHISTSKAITSCGCSHLTSCFRFRRRPSTAQRNCSTRLPGMVCTTSLSISCGPKLARDLGNASLNRLLNMTINWWWWW